MKRQHDPREQPRSSPDSPHADTMRLLKTGIFSLLLHIVLILFLILNLKPGITKGGSSVYRVTLRPFSPPGNEIPQGGSSPDLPGLPAPQPTEKPRPEDSQKGKETLHTVKLDQKKAERKVEKPAKAEISLAPKKQKTPDAKKDETLAKGEESDRSVQEAIEGIQQKVALEDIQKRVDRRGGSAGGSGGGTGSGVTAAEGSGSLPGSSTGQGDDKCGGAAVKAKIMKAWALPENLSKGGKGLETIIVIIMERDGKVKKSWLEKRSGNPLYDQMAMRAIKKAEPFPPIPQECTDPTFAIKFSPDQLAK
jgi:TonB family protein